MFSLGDGGPVRGGPVRQLTQAQLKEAESIEELDVVDDDDEFDGVKKRRFFVEINFPDLNQTSQILC